MEHLQPAGSLDQGIVLAVRSDIDTQFAAKAVQKYFKDKSIDQVFTHPYTPQENAYIESFHPILSRSLERTTFSTLAELETHHCEILHGLQSNMSPRKSGPSASQSFLKIVGLGLIDRIEQKFN